MRLHRLEIEGFGPFRERQSVDFDAFSDDGIFLISGRTGAGKSSILDAVCFGLYGGVPRYDGGEKRLRSDHSRPEDPSEVVVDFSTDAGRFRVTRAPEYLRPAKRGGGMTKQAATVLLEERVGDSWQGRAARAVDVGQELDEILQLSQGQFLQVILLAQNRFARFLLADSKERQALLRRLFGTERFDDVQRRFDERRRASELALGSRRATLDARLDEAEGLVTAGALWGEQTEAGTAGAGATQERLDALARALARAQYHADRARAERDEAESAATTADTLLATAREEGRFQAERTRARAELARLDADQPAISAAQHELDQARSAEVLRPTLLASARAAAAISPAADHLARAREAWDGFGVDLAVTDAAALDGWVADRMRERGGWDRAAELESRASVQTAEHAHAQERVTAAVAHIEEEDAERASLPELLAEVRRELEVVRRQADRRDERAAARDLADDRRTAAADVARLTRAEASADSALTTATVATAQAQNALAVLRQRRQDGMAGELAATLVHAEPCPVCGAREHPAPAAHNDPVSAEDIAAAERDRDAAILAEREAADRRAALRADLAGAVVRADGRSEPQAESDWLAAVAAYDEAVAAGVRAAEIEAQRIALEERARVLEQKRVESADALATAREDLVVHEQRAKEAADLIASARGSFDTVAERQADAAARIEAAQTLSEAVSEHARRTAAAAEALADQAAALAASSFASAEDAEASLRSAVDQQALESRVTSHAVQREKERAILLDLELRALPEEPIDLAPAEQAAIDARESWKVSVDVASRADGLVERLAGLVEAATADHAATAAQTAEHDLLKGLADTIAGRGENTRRMTLETFVLAAELEEIVDAANRRLAQMQDGRYQLRHSDALAARGAASGLGIAVYDAFTGQTRPVQSLSGGETFLCSLALALGLAEVVTARAGGIQLDTLFIDEGFGSLDADTLEVAMQTLDELRAGGRTVGVISHVESMQEQIPAQLRVEQTEAGPSRILPVR